VHTQEESSGAAAASSPDGKDVIRFVRNLAQHKSVTAGFLETEIKFTRDKSVQKEHLP